MFGKIHNLNSGKLFACCDKELIGKKLVLDDLEILISESFYGSESVDVSELLYNIDDCDQINIFGNNVCSILLEKKIISKDHLLYVDGVAHIQIYKM